MNTQVPSPSELPVGKGPYLVGQLLVSMPNMADTRFTRSVVYVCAHTPEGAMGLVVNQILEDVRLPEVLQQVGISVEKEGLNRHVHYGGPVEPGRGFVLHSTDSMPAGSIRVDDHVALNSTIDILRSIAQGQGPQKSLLALGYAGWGPGQLDAEIQENGWLIAPPDMDILFDSRMETKWSRALAKLGITPSALSAESGHA